MKQCIICKKDMPNAPAHQKTCSPECARKRKAYCESVRPKQSRAQHRDPIKCVICGEEFTPINKQNTICPNVACRRKAKRLLAAKESIEKVCEYCGKTYTTRNRRQLTCGYSCGRKLRGNTVREIKKDRPHVIATCAQCGRFFEKEYGSSAKTCSFECAGLVAAAKVTAAQWQADQMPCPWASRLFDTLPAPGYGWHTAEADPMSAGWAADGLWFVVRESETERERRAA